MPVLAFCQPPAASDSTEDRLIKSLCDGMIFDRVETPAGFRSGKKAVESRIAQYFRDANLRLSNGKATFNFFLLTDGNLVVVKAWQGHHEQSNDIIKALKQTAGLWTIARQRSRPVCSFIELEVGFTGNKVKVRKLN